MMFEVSFLAEDGERRIVGSAADFAACSALIEAINARGAATRPQIHVRPLWHASALVGGTSEREALLPFGWAPGVYIGMMCIACGHEHGAADKRSWHCRKCAEARREGAVQAAGAAA